MSVINQMLRDLDKRQKTGQAAVSTDSALRDITRDTVSVNPTSPTGRRSGGPRRVLVVVILGSVIALASLLAWLPMTRSADPVVASTAPAGESVAIRLAPAVAPPVGAASPAAAAGPAAASTAARPKSTVATPATVSSERGADATGPAIARTKSATPALAASAAPVAAPMQTALATPREREPVLAQPSRAQVAAEVRTQAQSLWEQGSRDAALRLLRDAVVALERSAAAGESTVLLSQAVRELTRMELSQGHAAEAMDLLQRLEPLLANQPEVWALRGNTAQRLGRHAESVQAYLTALKLRPGEARWMLGAAVSLAADGHTTQAAELAEQARERGALSPEVESYLRLQGVVLR